MNYLKLLSVLPQLSGIRTAVILDGEHQGHRMVFSDTMVVISCQPENSPLMGWLPLLTMIPESCTLSLGGQKIFLERLESQPELVICGGGHVARALIPMAKQMGFAVTDIEDREEFAKSAEEAGADRVICEDFTKALSEHPGGGSCYFVILTREHLFDQKCLEQILPKDWAYVGMLGSQSRTEMVRKRMLQKGFSPALVEQVHAPIGLDIGAETPEEIALSVMAEVVSVRRKGGQCGCYAKELLDGGKEGGAVLVTIVAKEGSTPRGVGTKFLVTAQGQTGTIGGGLMEAQVAEAARELLAGDEKCRLAEFDVNLRADEDTVVRSGTVTVLLERLEG